MGFRPRSTEPQTPVSGHNGIPHPWPVTGVQGSVSDPRSVRTEPRPKGCGRGPVNTPVARERDGELGEVKQRVIPANQ